MLEEKIRQNGDKSALIPINRLEEMKSEIEHFRQNEKLNGFQEYITRNMYDFNIPETDFSIQSIILIASPAPVYARIIFNYEGQKIPSKCLARSYPGKETPLITTEKYLTEFLTPKGYHIKLASQLPFKRLAVKSGLALYGRNNICFVEGMGSFLTFTAYFSDIPCDESTWYEVNQMNNCIKCTACLSNCPTGAISEDRFLINNERCLSYFNESPGKFPQWLPESVHHCIYDCLLCQIICPENKNYINNVIGPIEFDENETGMLLSRKKMEEFCNELREKVIFLGMDSWIDAIPRNIEVLIRNYMKEK